MPLTADSIQLGPFHGGVRYDIPIEECGPHELGGMENSRIGTAGQVEQRRGTDSFKDLAAVNSAATLTMCAQFNSNATTDHEIIVAGNKIYDYSSSAWTDRTGGLTVTVANDNTFEWVDANGVLVGTNGVDTDAFKIAGAANATALDDNARFTKGRHIAWFDNRLWIGNVNGATYKLWYSDTADIETWGATSFFNFAGIIQGLIPGQNHLTIHTTDGMYGLFPTGNATAPYSPQRLTEKAGIDGRAIVALPDDMQIMVREDGVYEWRGGSTLDKVSDALDGNYWPFLEQSRLFKSHAVRFPMQNEVWFFLPYKGDQASQTNMNHVMVYNYRKRTTVNGKNVGVWHGPYTGFERNCSALIDQKVHAGDFSGFLMDHDDDGHGDDGSNIESSMTTGAPAPLGPDVKVRWLNARHFYDGLGDYEIDVSQQGGQLIGSQEKLNLDGAGFQWDVSFWDIDSFQGISQQSQDLPLNGYGPESALKYSHGVAGQTWIIRRVIQRYKALGQFNKPKPVDS